METKTITSVLEQEVERGYDFILDLTKYGFCLDVEEDIKAYLAYRYQFLTDPQFVHEKEYDTPSSHLINQIQPLRNPLLQARLVKENTTLIPASQWYSQQLEPQHSFQRTSLVDKIKTLFLKSLGTDESFYRAFTFAQHYHNVLSELSGEHRGGDLQLYYFYHIARCVGKAAEVEKLSKQLDFPFSAYTKHVVLFHDYGESFLHFLSKLITNAQTAVSQRQLQADQYESLLKKMASLQESSPEVSTPHAASFPRYYTNSLYVLMNKIASWYEEPFPHFAGVKWDESQRILRLHQHVQKTKESLAQVLTSQTYGFAQEEPFIHDGHLLLQIMYLNEKSLDRETKTEEKAKKRLEQLFAYMRDAPTTYEPNVFSSLGFPQNLFLGLHAKYFDSIDNTINMREFDPQKKTARAKKNMVLIDKTLKYLSSHAAGGKLFSAQQEYDTMIPITLAYSYVLTKKTDQMIFDSITHKEHFQSFPLHPLFLALKNGYGVNEAILDLFENHTSVEKDKSRQNIIDQYLYRTAKL
ncbi:MAG: hypothetical protein QW594_03380 [Candidatus Woesearchaeota archaeon]